MPSLSLKYALVFFGAICHLHFTPKQDFFETLRKNSAKSTLIHFKADFVTDTRYVMIVLVGILVVMLSNPLLLLKASLTSGERPDTFDYPCIMSIEIGYSGKPIQTVREGYKSGR